MNKEILKKYAIYLAWFCILWLPSQGFCYGSTELFQQFPNKYFIESGSFTGNGIQQALDSTCFEIIHSIELSPMYYEETCHRFENISQVKLWLGDSGSILVEVLAGVDAPATIWLDAHYSGGSTAQGETLSPILRELECIKHHRIKTHTILIDDVYQFGTVHFDYVTYDDLVNKLREINPSYTIALFGCPHGEKDVLVAFYSLER